MLEQWGREPSPRAVEAKIFPLWPGYEVVARAGSTPWNQKQTGRAWLCTVDDFGDLVPVRPVFERSWQ